MYLAVSCQVPNVPLATFISTLSVEAPNQANSQSWMVPAPWLVGYLLGAGLHLALDMIFNGEVVPRSIVAFYSVAYRAAHRFDARTLLGGVPLTPAGDRFWVAFFRGARAVGAPSRERPLSRVARWLERRWSLT